MRPKKEFTKKNRVCLGQQIYTSQENFTQPLVVMVETFTMSDYHPVVHVFYEGVKI